LPEFFAEIALIASIRIASKTIGFCWLFAANRLPLRPQCDPVPPLWGIVLFSAAKSTRQGAFRLKSRPALTTEGR
jgi:hypothetical protein